MLTISSGYDPGYLTRAVATGRENYYLSAVVSTASHPGSGPAGAARSWAWRPARRWTTRSWSGSTARSSIPATRPQDHARPGAERIPGNKDRSRRGSPPARGRTEATAERRDQIIMQALKQQRATVFFFDATFSVPKSVSLLHASFQVRPSRPARPAEPAEAEQWDARAQTVWDAILAGNQAMLDYLQREAGYSRAGYHSKGSGRFVDAHEWVIASFGQHTSRDNDPQLHVHNAILNRVLREDPLASRPGDRRAWRTLDGAALYAARPAAAAIAERTMDEYLADRLGVEHGGAARRERLGNRRRLPGGARPVLLPPSRHRARRPGPDRGIPAQARKAPNARAVWSMAQFVTLDSRQPKAHSAPSREELLAQLGGAIAPRRDRGAQRHPGRRARPA